MAVGFVEAIEPGIGRIGDRDRAVPPLLETRRDEIEQRGVTLLAYVEASDIIRGERPSRISEDKRNSAA